MKVSTRLKSTIFYVITLGAAGYTLYLAFNGIELEGQNNSLKDKLSFFWDHFMTANIPLFMVSALFAILAHIIRAVRWQQLIAPVGVDVKLKETFISVMIGYFVNLAIPRGGEVSRSVSLSRLNKKVSVDSALGTIVAERLIDVLFLGLCIGGVLLIEFDKIIYVLEASEDKIGLGEKVKYLFFAAGGGILFLAVFYLVYKYSKLPFITKTKKKVATFAIGLKEGFMTMTKVKNKSLFAFYSLMIWACYYFMCYTLLLAFPSTYYLGPIAALTIFTIGGIAMSVPIPGGTGVYHVLVTNGMLLLYGVGSAFAVDLVSSTDIPQEMIIDKKTSLAFAFIFHLWQTLIIIVVGAVCMLLAQKMIKKNKIAAKNS